MFSKGDKVYVRPLDPTGDDGFRNVGTVVETHVAGICTYVQDDEDGTVYDVLDECITLVEVR